MQTTHALRPTEQHGRRNVPPTPHGASHPVRLCGLRATPSERLDKPPVVIERRDQDFVAGLLEDLKATAANVLAQAPARQGGLARLYPPVQRVFNLVVVEAACAVVGQPRLDPRKIDSCGLVVRRVRDGQQQAWIRSGTQVFGWDSVDEDLDPQPQRRAPVLSVGDPALNDLLPSNRALALAGAARARSAGRVVEEEVHPLFVAPPDVCAAAGRTLLFGLVPVTSSARTESTPAATRYGGDAAEAEALRAHLVHYLKAGGARNLARAGQAITPDWIKAADAQPQDPAGDTARLGTFIALLQQLQVEFDAFGTGAAAQDLRRALDAITVEFDTRDNSVLRTRREPAAGVLQRAARILLEARGDVQQVMPHRWGGVSESAAQSIFAATCRCLDAQAAHLLPAQGRFEQPPGGAPRQYSVRCFIRVRQDEPACPPQLVWSAPSEPFTIAPWFESAGVAVPPIELPNLFDRAQLARLRPNVAFALPPQLANLLRTDALALRDGKGSGDGLSLGWICSFSIPIITLCAFIVLNIFLQILNLIFFWLPFLKICIPYPKRGDS